MKEFHCGAELGGDRAAKQGIGFFVDQVEFRRIDGFEGVSDAPARDSSRRKMPRIGIDD